MCKRLSWAGFFLGLAVFAITLGHREVLAGDCTCKFYAGDPVFVAKDGRDLYGLAFARAARARATGRSLDATTRAMLDEALKPLPGGWRRLGGGLLTRRADPTASSEDGDLR